MHKALFVQRRYGFGSHDLAAAGAHGLVGDLAVNLPQRVLYQVAAIVYLSDNAVGFILAVLLRRLLCPA